MSDPGLRSDNPLDCAEAELLLGVLVLGAIDPGERYAAEAHVASCSRCAATFAGLAVLPGLLHRIDVEDATRLLSPVPPDFTRRVLAAHAEQVRAGHERRRRTVVLASVAAAVALFLAVAVPVALQRAPAGTSVATSPAQGATTVVIGTDAVTAVSARVTLSPRATGTSLALDLAGVEPGQSCQLVAVDVTGRREVAATWVASYEGSATVNGSAAMSLSAITTLQVVTTSGQLLVTMTVPHPPTL
jgi:hypothetical protein